MIKTRSYAGVRISRVLFTTFATTVFTALVATLAGCGANGSNGTFVVNPPGSQDSGGLFRLDGVPTNVDGLRQQLGIQGTAGYAWVSAVASYQTPPQVSQLFLKSALRQGSTFTYVLDTEPATSADLLEQLNQRGAQGYAYKGSYVAGSAYSVFVKDSAKSATYTYESLGSSGNRNLSNLLTQANNQGARGFRWLGVKTTSASGSAGFNLYARDSSGPANYTYTAHSLGSAAAVASGTSLLILLQQESASGAQYVGTVQAGTEFAMIFERPAGRTAALTYTVEAVPAGESAAALLQAINAKAADGVYLWSDQLTADGNYQRVYVKGLVLPHPLYGLILP